MHHSYRRPSILSANIFYLIAGIMLLTIGFLVQSRELYLGLIVTEYVLILIPNIIFIKMQGLSLKRVLRINGFSLKQLTNTILIVLFSYPIAVFFNMIALNIISVFSDFVPITVPLPMTLNELFVSFVIIAIAPGICEEVMFRGTMLSAYETIGYKKSIIITSLLFGIFHFNISNLVGPTFLGIILAIIALKSNSIFLPIIGHTLNNSIALVIGYFATKHTEDLNNLDAGLDTGVVTETMAIVVSTITIGIIALLCGLIVLRLIKKFPTTYEPVGPNLDTAGSKLRYIPVFIVLLIFIVLTCFTLKYA